MKTKFNKSSKAEETAKLRHNILDKKTVELDQDERIQQRLQQLEEQSEQLQQEIEQEKQQLEQEYHELRSQLQDDINKEKESLEQAKSTVVTQRLDLQNERQEILETYEYREQQLIENIQQKEAQIQQSYRLKLQQQWEQEYAEKRTKQELLIAQQESKLEGMLEKEQQLLQTAQQKSEMLIEQTYKLAQEQQEKAHKMVMEAEQTKVQQLEQARQRLETKYAELNADYEAKLMELLEKENGLKKRQILLSISEQDVELLQQSYKQKQQHLKEQMELLSPARVEQLEFEIQRLEQIKQADYEIIEDLKEEIKSLKKLIPDDELRSISTIAEEVELLQRENNRLKDMLAQVPSEQQLLFLKALPKKVEFLEDNLTAERQARINAESRAENLQIGVLELEQTKRVTETLKTVNAQLQQELDKINEVYKQNTQSKFPGLVEIDQLIQANPSEKKMHANITMPELVKYLQNYGAIELGLYYSDKMIRAFLASLASSKLIILQGLSGTGKSSLARLFKEAIHVKHSLIPVQPSWRDNRELLGYDNDFTRRFKETVFTKKVYEASAPENQQNIYFIVLDEMNLARIEYYFADFLAVMEEHQDDWKVALVSNNEELEVNRPKYLVENGTSLMVSQNIWFIGTANRDESTFGITDKVYDRAQVINFVKREEQFTATKVDKIELSYEQFNTLLTKPMSEEKHRLSKDDRELLATIDEQLQVDFDITFGNRIEMQLERFVATYSAAGGSKQDAIDYVIAHKVLRKLEGRYESYLVKKLKELLELFDALAGKDAFMECRKVIEQKLSRLGE